MADEHDRPLNRGTRQPSKTFEPRGPRPRTVQWGAFSSPAVAFLLGHRRRLSFRETLFWPSSDAYLEPWRLIAEYFWPSSDAYLEPWRLIAEYFWPSSDAYLEP